MERPFPSNQGSRIQYGGDIRALELHERIMPSGLNDNSHFDFSDVKRWLKMAQEEFGLYTIVRPGPFICAEYSGGGYPRWLAKFCPGGMDDFWLRSADHRHISWSQHWFDAVCKALPTSKSRASRMAKRELS